MSNANLWPLYVFGAFAAVYIVVVWCAGWRMAARDRKPWAPPVVREREGLWPCKVIWVDSQHDERGV